MEIFRCEVRALGIWEITTVGLSMVFIIFTILYFLFIFMEYITKFTTKEQTEPVVKEKIEMKEDEEEIAAVFAAIYRILGKNVRIKKITRGERGWETWKKHGWRGVRRWRENSR